MNIILIVLGLLALSLIVALLAVRFLLVHDNVDGYGNQKDIA